MEYIIKNLEELGFNSFFEFKAKEIDKSNLSPARVIAEYKESYKVKNTKGEFLAKITGKIMFEATNREDYPAVGDWVMISETNSEHTVIKNILTRQTIIKRRFGDKNKSGEKSNIQVIATNIDVGFIIESVDRDYNLNRIERYFAILKEGGVDGVIVLNKTDLISDDELNVKLDELRTRFPSTNIIVTSTKKNYGLVELKSSIESGKTYCFMGSSGVGKSSLINTLIGKGTIKTGGISSYSERGKHTTTGRQMYFLDNGGIVIDNPGIREVGIVNPSNEVYNFSSEILSLEKECKYTNCTHIHEPGCVILEAVQSGTIDKEKYDNYKSLKKEAEYLKMDENQKRQKGKDFGKFIKKTKKELNDFRYGKN